MTTAAASAPRTSGVPATAATHIILDRNSPPDARILCDGGFGRGVYKSVNGGRFWTLKNSGLPATRPFARPLAQPPGGTLYVIVARRSADSRYRTALDGAVYRSTDGAESWQRRATLPEGARPVDGRSEGGAFVSSEAGAPWRLTLDPRDASILYACGLESNAWRFADGGETGTRLRGYNFK